jgi:triphosphoribosyl-dephospho-CoA synthase
VNTAINLLINPTQAPEIGASSSDTMHFSLDRLIGNLAYHAMMLEVHLTPKPGLVDTLNNGSHHDMNLGLFVQSAEAITPFMTRCVTAGWEHSSQPASQLLTVLRPIGIEAEQAMFTATHHVNTHKGMIFSLGLVCGAVGWLKANQIDVDALHISKTIARSCHHLVFDELKACRDKPAQTQGEQLFKQYGATGARGEAASGLATVIKLALPAYQLAIKDGLSTEQALWHTLLVLMAHNNDTNLLARGGKEGLRLVQDHAHELLAQGGGYHPNAEVRLINFDQILIAKHLSPGGSADLLAITWFIAELEQLFSHRPLRS